MVSEENEWRILHNFINELNFNLAVDEAILRCIQECLSKPTLRLWRSNQPSIILNKSDEVPSKILNEWKSLGLNIARSCMNGCLIYNDEGVLNITITSNELKNKLSFKRLHELTYEFISSIFLKFDLKPIVNEELRLILVNNKILASISSASFYDSNLIFAALYISPNLNFITKTLSQTSSLEKEANIQVNLNEIKSIVKNEFEKVFNTTLIEEKLNEKEEETAERLYKIKYSKDEWIIKGEEPLTLKDILIEVYVAYPPTSLDRKFIEAINKAIEPIKDKVEVRIWKRGRGIPPGVNLTPGLRKASKESIIPALIVNGELKLGRITFIPSENELKKIFEDALKEKN